MVNISYIGLLHKKHYVKETNVKAINLKVLSVSNAIFGQRRPSHPTPVLRGRTDPVSLRVRFASSTRLLPVVKDLHCWRNHLAIGLILKKIIVLVSLD